MTFRMPSAPSLSNIMFSGWRQKGTRLRRVSEDRAKTEEKQSKSINVALEVHDWIIKNCGFRVAKLSTHSEHCPADVSVSIDAGYADVSQCDMSLGAVFLPRPLM